MKKVNRLIAVLMLCGTQAFSGSFLPSFPGSSTSGDTSNSNIVVMKDMFSSIAEDDLAESQKLLAMSEKLKAASLNLDATQGLNKQYIEAMLALATEIGKMADRIGEMADRIVQTEVLIGEMADRIVVVAQSIINNCAQTQLNLLEAQRNFNALLTTLANQ